MRSVMVVPLADPSRRDASGRRGDPTHDEVRVQGVLTCENGNGELHTTTGRLPLLTGDAVPLPGWSRRESSWRSQGSPSASVIDFPSTRGWCAMARRT